MVIWGEGPFSRRRRERRRNEGKEEGRERRRGNRFDGIFFPNSVKIIRNLIFY